jgi:hypothetical protein
MAKDWSRSGLDRKLFGVERAPVRRPAPTRHSLSAPLQLGQLGLAGKCFLAGVMAALLYIWPVLMVTYFLSGGFRGVVFWSILAGAAVAFSIAFWVISRLESRYWASNWHTLSEFADPPTWK